MVEELKALGVETIVDTEGEPLLASLRAEPAAVTPNVREAEGAVGHEFNDREDLLTGLRSLVELGAAEAVITRPEGCVASLLGDDEQRHTYEVTAPEVEPVATVGSGDAFLAGFVAARYDGRPPEECLRFAVACGAESTQHFGAGSIDPAEVERLLLGGRGRASSRRPRRSSGPAEPGLTAVILGGALVKDLRIAASTAFSAPRRGVFSSANEPRIGQWK